MASKTKYGKYAKKKTAENRAYIKKDDEKSKDIAQEFKRKTKVKKV